MEHLPSRIARVISIDAIVAVSEPVVMKAAIRSAAQMNTADVSPPGIGPTKVHATETTNMRTTEMGPADVTAANAADVATTDAADMATTDAAADPTDMATTEAADVAATEATTSEAANRAPSEGSRRNCGATQKDSGDRGHHHFSQHQSLHSHIVRSTISFPAEHRSSLRLSRQRVQPLRVSLQYLVVDLRDCFVVIAPLCPGLLLSAA
jgi:hypothetical protein